MSATVPQKDSGDIFKTLGSNKTPNYSPLPDLTANIDPLTKRPYQSRTNQPNSVVKPMIGSTMYGFSPADTFRTPQEIEGGAPTGTNRTPQEILGGAPTGTNRTPQEILGGVPPPVVPEAKGADPPTQPVVNPTPVSATPLRSFKNLLNEWIDPNPLNQYRQATYHFQLFILDDLGFRNATAISQVLAKVNASETNQVIIAESGVTGYNIRDVEINTVNSQNGKTLDQKATFLTMTVVEPMGVTFLDAMFHSASLLNVWDYTKMVYYLKLTFTGYKEDGTFAGDPIPLMGKTPYENGGQWIWALNLMDIDTKVNEGGGVYTLHFVHTETQALVTESDKLALPDLIKTEGTDLKTLFEDYTKKFNDAYAAENGKDPGGKFVLSIKIKADHPILFGEVYKDKKPESFKLTNKDADRNSVRALALDEKGGTGGTAANTVPPGMTVNQFITAAILSTEEGQELVKDVPVVAKVDKDAAKADATADKDKDTTTPEVRISQLFSIETVVKLNGRDEISGKYVKEITFHVVPTTSQSAILTRKQANDYKSPEAQLLLFNNLCTNGFLQKRYDYIFTGLNTEIIDFDVHFKMVWQALVPKGGGTRVSVLNDSYHARAPTPANPPDAQAEATTGAKVTTEVLTPTIEGYQPPVYKPGVGARIGNAIGDAVTSTIGAGNSGAARGNVIGGAVTSVFGPQAPKPALDMTQDTEANYLAGKAATESIAKAAIEGRAAKIQANAQAQNIGKIYVEDVLNNINQGRMGGVTDRKTRLPITFSQGNLDIISAASTATNPQVHIDRPIAGAVYAQLHENTMTGGFMNIELTIRGDPFWLGQGNLERQIILENNLPTHKARSLPNGSSGNHCIYLYFRNPLQMGDDFRPVLSDNLAFNNLYQINRVKHTFAEGQFKQVLIGTILSLYNLDLIMTADPNVVNSGPASPLAANAKPDAGTVNATADTKTNSNTPGSGTPVTVSSKDTPLTPNVIAAHDRMIAAGYSEAKAAGILGYYRGESGPNLDTNAYNSAGGGQGAQGIAQWRGPRVDGFRAANGQDPRGASLDQQVDYTMHELNTSEAKAGRALNSAPTAAAAGDSMLRLYGRPKASEVDKLAAQRAGFAESYAKQFAARKESA